MNYQEYVDSLTPEMIARLRRGVETGRWPDGRALTPQQREHSLQAVIAWEETHLPEHQRVGYIDPGSKGEAPSTARAESTLRWVDDGDSA